MCCVICFFFFKQKTAYEMRISDWSSDVCSSDLPEHNRPPPKRRLRMSNHGCAGFWRLVVAYRNLPIALAWRMVLVGGPASVECGLLCLGWCLARLCSEMGTISMVVTGTYDPYLVARSEEHTSELQSLMRHSYAVFCLKKK